jgi:hypothetical protein
MKFKLAVIFLILSFNCFGSNMEQGKEQAQKLFDAVLPLAKELLKENGEFFPFGEIMKPNGEQVNLSVSNGDERPSSSDLIALLKNHFIESAQASDIIASALVYDVRVKGSDSIAVDLDHANGYSVTVIVPYELTEKELVIGQMFTMSGKRAVFN